MTTYLKFYKKTNKRNKQNSYITIVYFIAWLYHINYTNIEKNIYIYYNTKITQNGNILQCMLSIQTKKITLL